MSNRHRRALLQVLPAAALARLASRQACAQDAPAAPLRRSLRTSDGVQLSLLEQRPAGGAAAPGPVLVLLPGWCMPASIWGAQLDSLGARWRTIAMDPRGQGESEIPARGYTADRRADDLHDVLEQVLGAGEQAVLVGWSLGVLEALQYVYRHGSARLCALALVDNSIGEPPPPAAGGNFPQELSKAREATLDRFIRAMFTHPPGAELIARIRASTLRMPLQASLALLSYPQPREHWREVVHAFEQPLAYLVTPRYREQSQNLQRTRPRARVEVFEHAGHALFVDEASRFNTVLAEWIQAIPGD